MRHVSLPALHWWTRRRERWVLLEPLTYVDDAGKAWVVPEKLDSDFSSIPLPVRMLLRLPFVQTRRPGLVHDFLYRKRETGTREHADALYQEMLRAEEVPGWKARVAYRGLRLFGGSSYAKRVWPDPNPDVGDVG